MDVGGYTGAVCSTDGNFFDDMRAKERKILEELGEYETIKLLDEEYAQFLKDAEEELAREEEEEHKWQLQKEKLESAG